MGRGHQDDIKQNLQLLNQIGPVGRFGEKLFEKLHFCNIPFMYSLWHPIANPPLHRTIPPIPYPSYTRSFIRSDRTSRHPENSLLNCLSVCERDIPNSPQYLLISVVTQQQHCICPKYPCICPKFYCICPKYLCMYAKYHCICPTYHCFYPTYHCICNKKILYFFKILLFLSYKKNTTVFAPNKSVFAPKTVLA